ncbi:MAG: hypothetical protein M0R70_04755 [Nitrospirae bacterium]|nr:hypothetical protein [Nitrospirota bacterium]
MKTLIIMMASVIGLILLTGCTGARNMVKADGARYDISLSRAIRDNSGQVIPSERLETVGTFRQTAYGWGIFWSFVPFNTIDISNSVNSQVEKAGGIAITNLAVDVNSGLLNYIPILNWLPIWPGYNVVDFTGDIVKIKADAGASPVQSDAPIN